VNQVLPYFVVLGPPLVLALAFATMSLVWHRELSTGKADEARKSQITRRCMLFASLIKNLGWAYLLVVISLAVFGKLLRRE